MDFRRLLTIEKTLFLLLPPKEGDTIPSRNHLEEVLLTAQTMFLMESQLDPLRKERKKTMEGSMSMESESLARPARILEANGGKKRSLTRVSLSSKHRA